MSDPLTAGLIFGGFSILQGFSQASSLNKQADRVEAEGREEADRKRRDVRRLLGLGRANIGGSGLQVEGSPLEVLADNAAEGELDALTAKSIKDREAADLRSQASGAIFSGFIGAGSALLEPAFGSFSSSRSIGGLATVQGARAAHP